MKGKKAKKPFLGWLLYGPRLHEKEDRNYVVLYNKETKKRKCTSYSRYLMQVKLGRLLTKNEHVDHIDNNHKNDVIENLQILTLAENNKKLGKSRGRLYARLKCPNCLTIFEKPENQTHLKNKAKKADFCSRICSKRFWLTKNKVKNIENNLIEVFRKF